MSDRIVVATRKGLFIVDRGADGWGISKTAFLGDTDAVSVTVFQYILFLVIAPDIKSLGAQGYFQAAAKGFADVVPRYPLAAQTAIEIRHKDFEQFYIGVLGEKAVDISHVYLDYQATEFSE